MSVHRVIANLRALAVRTSDARGAQRLAWDRCGVMPCLMPRCSRLTQGAICGRLKVTPWVGSVVERQGDGAE